MFFCSILCIQQKPWCYPTNLLVVRTRKWFPERKFFAFTLFFTFWCLRRWFQQKPSNQHQPQIHRSLTKYLFIEKGPSVPQKSNDNWYSNGTSDLPPFKQTWSILIFQILPQQKLKTHLKTIPNKPAHPPPSQGAVIFWDRATVSNRKATGLGTSAYPPGWSVSTLPETNIFAPEHRPGPKRKRESIPTIHFPGRKC